ncbi:MAG: hypothetical protein U5N56_00045 [Candidatus Marinimicrobia bacterium]|nr:hypothetical protein [Candidatus Neomarinimicrobiota bacterium]MDZ7821571.1 hypothetical protein [Candidatus Neomarinimicrobiota bacterium]
MALQFDTSVVKVYKMIGGVPHPEYDTYLGQDTTIDEVAGEGYWDLDISLSEGRHNIYSVAYDLAGNESIKDQKSIIVLPSPFKVSSGIDWQIGEIGAVTIGECN